MAQTRSQDERNRIYDERAAGLKATLATAHLPAEDRDLAQTLFDNSKKLTKIDDPATEADRFNDIADKVVARMDAIRIDLFGLNRLRGIALDWLSA